jgi:hypothetical protein
MPRAPKPTDLPEGSVGFGGDVERVKACLRVVGDELDPDEITGILGRKPTRAGRKGEPVLRPNGEVGRLRRIGAWLLDIMPEPEATVDEVISALLGELPQDPELWRSLTQRFQIDVLCDVTVRGINQGFVLSPETLKNVAALGISLGVDIFPKDDPEQEAGLAKIFRSQA